MGKNNFSFLSNLFLMHRYSGWWVHGESFIFSARALESNQNK
jgi:hypothetical protein